MPNASKPGQRNTTPIATVFHVIAVPPAAHEDRAAVPSYGGGGVTKKVLDGIVATIVWGGTEHPKSALTIFPPERAKIWPPSRHLSSTIPNSPAGRRATRGRCDEAR